MALTTLRLGERISKRVKASLPTLMGFVVPPAIPQQTRVAYENACERLGVEARLVDRPVALVAGSVVIGGSQFSPSGRIRASLNPEITGLSDSSKFSTMVLCLCDSTDSTEASLIRVYGQPQLKTTKSSPSSWLSGVHCLVTRAILKPSFEGEQNQKPSTKQLISLVQDVLKNIPAGASLSDDSVVLCQCPSAWVLNSH